VVKKYARIEPNVLNKNISFNFSLLRYKAKSVVPTGVKKISTILSEKMTGGEFSDFQIFFGLQNRK
jgi:hypothetical protein